MKKRIYLLFLIIKYLCIPLNAQTPVVANHAFQTGEKISYDVFYSVVGIYLKAGTATFTTMNATMQNREVYHVIELQPENFFV